MQPMATSIDRTSARRRRLRAKRGRKLKTIRKPGPVAPRPVAWPMVAGSPSPGLGARAAPLTLRPAMGCGTRQRLPAELAAATRPLAQYNGPTRLGANPGPECSGPSRFGAIIFNLHKVVLSEANGPLAEWAGEPLQARRGVCVCESTDASSCNRLGEGGWAWWDWRGGTGLARPRKSNPLSLSDTSCRSSIPTNTSGT